MRLVTSDNGLLDSLLDQGYDFFTGVPDSGLKGFISDLSRLPSDRHVTATWEAEAIGIAAGASLAFQWKGSSGRVPTLRASPPPTYSSAVCGSESRRTLKHLKEADGVFRAEPARYCREE